MFLRRTETGQSQTGAFRHPFDGNVAGVHYADIAIDGSFSFVFNGPASWSSYTDVLLFVTRSNEAVHDLKSSNQQEIFMNVGDDGFGNNVVAGVATFLSSEGAKLPITNNSAINYSNVSIRVNQTDGAILRYMQMSRKFAQARGIAVPEESA